MKVLQYHVNVRLEKGGTIRFLLDLSLCLARHGHEVTIASPDPADIPAEWQGSGLPRSAPLPGPALPGAFLRPGALLKLRSLIRSHDVLHLHGAWGTSNVQAARIAREEGVPYVVNPHGMLDDWCVRKSPGRKRLFHALGGRALFERAAVVICTAQAELDQSAKWFPGGRGVVIPPVVDLAPYAKLPGPELARKAFPPAIANAPTVLFLSRVHPKKKVEVLIEATTLLKREGLDCNLVIAGAGVPEYETDMKQLVRARAVGDRVAFVGMVKGETKISLYQLADVFALPTSQENFGLVLTESMLCGTPVITTRGVDIWPELESSGGAIVAPDTSEAFAAAIGGLLRDRVRREAMSKAGEAWARAYLEPERVIEQYAREYALAGRADGAGHRRSA